MKENKIGTNVFKLVTIFIVLYISYLSIYLSRQSLSVATPVLDEKLIMKVSEIGILGTVFSLVYSIGRLINGRIGDKIQPKYMICLGLLIIFLTNFCFSLFLPFVLEAILWGLNAYGQSMLWGPILRILAKYMPKDKITKLTSIMATSIPMGTMVGIVFCTKLIVVDVKYAFYLPAFISLACCAAVFFLIGKFKAETKTDNNEEKNNKETPKLGNILKNKLLLATVGPALLHGVVKENVNLWLTTYFVIQFGFSEEKLTQSIIFMFAIPIIGVIGRLLYPTVYKMLNKNEFNVEIFGFIIIFITCGILVAIPANKDTATGIIILAAVCLGLINAAINLINHSVLTMIPLKFNKINSSSTAAGIIDFTVYIGAAGGSLIYGELLENNVPFAWIFASWIFIAVLSIMILLYSNKKKFLDIF